MTKLPTEKLRELAVCSNDGRKHKTTLYWAVRALFPYHGYEPMRHKRLEEHYRKAVTALSGMRPAKIKKELSDG